MVCAVSNCNDSGISKVVSSFDGFEIIIDLCLVHSLKFEKAEDFNQKIICTDQFHV